MSWSVVWDFLKEQYDEMEYFIKEIKSDTIRGVAFAIFWIIIILVMPIILALSISSSPLYQSKWIGLTILLVIIFFEIFIPFGRWVKIK